MTKTIQNTIFKHLVLTFCFVVFSGCAAQWLNRIPVHSIKCFNIPVENDISLPLIRLQPRTFDKDAPVLLLVGSPLHNLNFWTLDESVHLPMFFAKQGWDVWAFSFRKEGRRDAALIFEDYIFRDLATIIEHVQRLTGRDKIAVLGYGFGGTALVSYLKEMRPNPVHQAVVVATPYRYYLPLPDCFKLSLESDFAQKVYFSFENISEDVERDFLMNAQEPVPLPVATFYHSLIHTGGLKTDLSQVENPVLFVSGKTDNLAPTKDMLRLYQNWGGEHKAFREFGLSNFYKHNYNHYDLILGRYARTEVYPFILNWLNAHE